MFQRWGSTLPVRDERGFTVVEVLIAAAIVVVGLLALATMFPTGYSTVTQSGIQSTGLALAQQRIEFLRNQATTQTGYNIISNGTTTENSITVGNQVYTRTTVVTENPTVNGVTVNGAKRVDVTVTPPIDCPLDLRPCPCPDPTKRLCVTLTSIIAK